MIHPPKPRSLLAALLTLLLVGCSRETPTGRDVILITLDTTRADRLAAYGCPDVRTPAIDRLAREGALVEVAIADVPVTLPSHTTIMTGVPALGHGVRFNSDFKVAPTAATLAEEYSDLGYTTAAVVSTVVLDPKFGLDQGFAHYDSDLTPGYLKHDESKFTDQDHWLPKAHRRATATMDAVLAWLGDRPPSPYFLWVHLYDAHFPFDPPPPWNRANSDGYLAELQYTDRELLRLFRWIDEHGRPDDTVVLLTADHGEGLDQHREDGHGIFLYDDTVRVPLLVRSPDALAGTVIPHQVPTIDIAPTLLALSGFPSRHLGIGVDIVGLLRGDGDPPDSVTYTESMKTRLFYGGSGLKSVRTRNAKYVWAPHPELYDLARDPGETTNVAELQPALAREMRALLAERVREILDGGLASVEPANADDATLRSLQSLGYVSGSDGGARPGSFEEEMSLRGADPKDLVDVSMGAREIQNGYYDRGEEKLLRFFATARKPADDAAMARLWAAAHQNYGKIWMVRGDYGRAAEEYARASRADPGYDNARWSRIYALNLAGQAARAERESAALLEERPRAWQVRLHRGLALALLGRTEEAGGEFAKIIEKGPPGHGAVKSATFFATKLGTRQERAVLGAYLESEAKRRNDGTP